MKIEPLNGNWVDLVIFLVLLYFALDAVRNGFLRSLAGLASFLGSLLIALRFYSFAANILRTNFSLSHPVSNALGFLVTAIISEVFLGYGISLLISKVQKEIEDTKLKPKYKRLLPLASKVFGILISLGEGLILIAFVLTLFMGLPIKPSVKIDISESKIGGVILAKTSGLELVLHEIFGGVVDESLTHLTVKPGSRESIPLQTEPKELSIDEKSESELFRLVNEERKKRGIEELLWRPEVVPVARMHAKDMWERSYFSHYSPEGEDVGDRLQKAKVSYSVAGENLALAPTLSMAHRGLMNSESHRANILEQKFKRIGIGVIDNGVYGKIFVQVFTD